MKVLQPTFYDEFKCAADKCEDTCCGEWNIDIDKHTFKRYRKVKGQIGKKINCSIKRIKDERASDIHYGRIKLNSNLKCPFLDDKKLCGLYKELDESYLCDVCKAYPRKLQKYGEIRELSLSPSCPEVVRCLAKKKKIQFEARDLEITESILKNEIKFSFDRQISKNITNLFYDFLFDTRALLMKVIQFDDIEVWKRVVFVNYILEKLQGLVVSGDLGDYKKYIEELEKYATESSVIKEYDNIKTDKYVKFELIRSILINRTSSRISCGEYMKLYDYYNIVFDDMSIKEAADFFEEKEKQFDEYFKDKNYVIENYISCILYNNFMESIKDLDIKRKGVELTVLYTIIHFYMVLLWINNDYEIDDKDVVKAIYSVSRAFDNSKKYFFNLYMDIKKNNYDSLAFLTTLIR